MSPKPVQPNSDNAIAKSSGNSNPQTLQQFGNKSIDFQKLTGPAAPASGVNSVTTATSGKIPIRIPKKAF